MMAPSYLTRSRVAWVGIALILAGFGVQVVSSFVELPVWLLPVGYFAALIGAAVMFVGWVIWRRR